jgi:hypothetical protein
MKIILNEFVDNVQKIASFAIQTTYNRVKNAKFLLLYLTEIVLKIVHHNFISKLFAKILIAYQIISKISNN